MSESVPGEAFVPNPSTGFSADTVSAADLIRESVRTLAAVGAPSPVADARTLVGLVLGLTPTQLLTAGNPTGPQLRRVRELVSRRAAGVPLQHLTREAWFRTVRLTVGPGVFVPRPETEVMTGWALARLAELPAPATVVELCAGSGAISLALVTEAPEHHYYAVEKSPTAYAYAATNLAGTGVDLREGDMADAFADLTGRVDLVVVNPPYIPLTAYEQVAEEVRRHEPELALFSGDDGLDATRQVARIGQRLLRPGGRICSEHAEVQGESAPAIFVAAGYDQVRDHPDLTRRPRFVTARRPGPAGA
ncbi:peptide chain release factor N(5)-glutamine methyltransferase [Granulicoccus phenolivorans]|uniref:peptide chain release factor N(5)-glutamine methyltransferase n=1 Tax=Granulicoccus phenolivorans TaxID=266854 RepID=UPI000B29A289|nr:peptide chain release factor N(5)-glutamine methyltransferase [Granulicoccus phenolivorans]